MESIAHWLTVEQVAAHLQISKETIYRWLDRGLIPAHKVGKQWRFQSSEVDEWVRNGGAIENHRSSDNQSNGVYETNLKTKELPNDQA